VLLIAIKINFKSYYLEKKKLYLRMNIDKRYYANCIYEFRENIKKEYYRKISEK